MNTRSPFPSPPEALPPKPFIAACDQDIDDESPELPVDALDAAMGFTLSSPRHDSAENGTATKVQTRGTSVGPRQRRFGFDALVIRDSIVLKLRAVDREDLAGPLDDCHREAVYKRCRGCRATSVFYNRCERVGCPICASRLARDRRESVAWYAREVQQPKHVVLTVYSVHRLTKEWVRQLKRDWKKLRSRKFAKSGDMWQTGCDARTHRPLFKRTTKWRGGFWSLDVTWSKPHDSGEWREKDGRTWITQEATPGGFHVHFHALVDADYIDRDRLEDEWCDIRGQSIAVCRVYDVRGKDYTAEVCKYVSDGVSLGNWPPHVLVQFYDSFNGERTFDCFGQLYKLRKARREALEALLSKWDTCQCGCMDFDYIDQLEWEAEGCKAPRPPPEFVKRPVAVNHPELFTPTYQFPR